MEVVQREAIQRVQEAGIVFIDEIDKIAGAKSQQGPDVSREGVQRDLLPIVEGSTVNTKIWSGKNRSYFIYCFGCVPCLKTERFDPGTSRTFPYPG